MKGLVICTNSWFGEYSRWLSNPARKNSSLKLACENFSITTSMKSNSRRRELLDFPKCSLKYVFQKCVVSQNKFSK
ncbi:hypothetical protein LguiB_013238 [Lonicera macranthoides]